MMNRTTLFSIVASASLMLAGQAPAGTKPCRDKAGKIIDCPKPRKASPRCKDAQGRFVACPQPASAGADLKQDGKAALDKPN